MTSVDDIYSKQSHLKASDLQGQEVTLKVSGYEVVDFNDGPKVVLSFSSTDKTLVLNKTNANTIAQRLGGEFEGWVGHTITIFPSQADFQGQQVPCIRVKIETSPPATNNTQRPTDGIPF